MTEPSMTWLTMLEKRIMLAPPDSPIVVDTEAKRALAIAAIDKLRPADGLYIVIDEEPAYPWWLDKQSDEP